MNKIIGILLIICTISCTNIERVDTTKIKEQMQGYKVKRVTQNQIINQVEAMGSKISESLTKEFTKQLNGANQPKTEELCQLKNNRLIDSLSNTYDLKIRLLGQPDIGSNNQLYAKEKEVLEAYTFNLQNKKTMQNNHQKIGDSLFVYTAPISAEKGIGKACFSDDSGFAIWSIILKKSEVVKLVK